jgi:protein-disulfide isomerase
MQNHSENSGIKKKKFHVIITLALGYVLFVIPSFIQCQGKSAGKFGFVSVNGKKYSIEDLEKASPALVYKAKSEYNQAIERAFSEFAIQKALELEAAEKKTTVAELTKAGTNYEPGDAEIQAVYTQYKSQLQGKSLDDVRDDITGFLKNRKEEEFRSKLISDVRSKYKIEVSMEPLARPKLAVEDKGNPSIGPKDAKVTIIEFSDFECPYCQKSQIVNKQLRAKYKDKIRWVFRDYPLPFHPNAKFAHIAANCAIEDGKYWEVFEEMFKHTGDLAKENVRYIVEKAGVSKEKFEKCIADGKMAKEVETDLEDGRKLGVNGTPAFFINGISVEGAQPFSSFEEIIEKELKN